MSARTHHDVPPLLAAIATYALDQPPLGTLEAALTVARGSVQLDNEEARDSALIEFVQHEGERDEPALTTLTRDERIAALMGYGQAGILVGLALGWLLLHEKGGSR